VSVGAVTPRFFGKNKMALGRRKGFLCKRATMVSLKSHTARFAPLLSRPAAANFFHTLLGNGAG